MEPAILAALITAAVAIGGWFIPKYFKSQQENERSREENEKLRLENERLKLGIEAARHQAAERAREQKRISAGIVFETIRDDPNNPYWGECPLIEVLDLVLDSPIYPDDWKLAKERLRIFSPSLGSMLSDPSFDVILKNNHVRPVSIVAVGVEILYVMSDWRPSETLPETYKLETSETYHIEMPHIMRWLEEQNSRRWREGQSPLRVAEINEVYKKPCAPYVLESEARFRYTLVLKYYERMPNHVILQLYVETGEGVVRSDPIYLGYPYWDCDRYMKGLGGRASREVPSDDQRLSE
jgi:hypothetical protein